MAKKKKLNLPTKEDIEQFEIAYPMLISVLQEMRELSKKKQDGALNLFKAKMINKLLTKFRSILRDEPSLEYLEILDEEVLPSNSDAVLILVQFKSVLAQFKQEHQRKEGGSFDFEIDSSTMVWTTED